MVKIDIKLLISKLNDVITKKITREELSTWALKLINEDINVEDDNAWTLLTIIGGIDLQTAPNMYLYSEEDFKEWINEYDR